MDRSEMIDQIFTWIFDGMTFEDAIALLGKNEGLSPRQLELVKDDYEDKHGDY